MIIKLKDIDLNTFERCLFEKEYGEIENFDDIYDDFIQASGLDSDSQLGLLSTILYYEARIVCIDTFIAGHRKALKLINMPILSRLNVISHYGHKVTWDGSVDNFEKLLSRIELKEKRNVEELAILNKELDQIKAAEKSHDETQARNQFLLMIELMKKENWKIDGDTKMDKVALMIKEQARQVDQMRVKERQ